MIVRERLYHDHPVYDDLSPHYPRGSLPHGWGADDPIFGQLIGELRPALIVEVGAFLGASAIRMAQETTHVGVSSEVVAIDTWLGWPDCWTRNGRHLLRLRGGYPHLFDEFRQNVVNYAVDHIVTPCPMTSGAGLMWLASEGFRPDLIYVDGSHEYDDVRRDMEAGFVLKPRVMFGHDCDDRHPGVVGAVEFWRSRGFEIEVRGPFWVWRRE